jgi:hypothetical protein
MYMETANATLVSTTLSLKTQEAIIIFCALVAILFGAYNVHKIMAIHISKNTNGSAGYNDLELDSLQDGDHHEQDSGKVLQNMADIAKLIQDGASTFLRQEYLFTFIFVCLFAVVIFLTVDGGHFYTTIAFLLGACISILSGYIGMQIAV